MNRQLFINIVDDLIGEDNTRVAEYRKIDKSTPSCMAGIQWLLREKCHLTDIGLPDTNSCTFLYNSVWAYPKINHSYETAETGDLILFQNFDDIPNDADHIAIVVENDKAHKMLKLLNMNGSQCNRWSYEYYSHNYENYLCIIDMSNYFTDDVKENLSDSVEKLKNLLTEFESVVKEIEKYK